MWSLRLQTLKNVSLIRKSLLNLRRFRSSNICNQMFYLSVVASTIFSAVVSWVAGIRAKDAIILIKLIKKAGTVVGSELVTLEEVAEDIMLAKLLAVMDRVADSLKTNNGHLVGRACRHDCDSSMYCFYVLLIYFTYSSINCMCLFKFFKKIGHKILTLTKHCYLFYIPYLPLVLAGGQQNSQGSTWLSLTCLMCRPLEACCFMSNSPLWATEKVHR